MTESGLRHLDLKAAVRETTDAGEFTALAAGWNLDRTNERIIKGAFADTIRRWRASGKDVPLAWDHGRDARDIIGSIDPASMEERDDGLFVEGTLDIQDSELAREAWRSVKCNRISLSFGYKVDDERTGADGVKELISLDMYEVTLTSVPANPDARVLSAKTVTDSDSSDFDSMSDAELKDYSLGVVAGVDTKAQRKVQVLSFPC